MVVILSFTSPFFPKVMKSWIFGGFILVGIGFLVFDFGVVSFITPRFGSNWSRSADACGVASRNLWELKMERRRVLLQERTQQIRSWMSSKSIKPKIAYDLFEPDYDCNTKTRVGARYFGDGPKFMCDVEVIPPQKKCLVYSVGSNGDFSFETAIFKRFECEIHTFDPTDTTGTWKDKAKSAHAVFHDLGLGEKKEFVKIMRTHAQKKKPKCALDTFRNIVRSLGHDERMIDVLKIDCEGCEWNVFPDIWKDLEKGVYRIGQILVEVHGTDLKRAIEFFEGARKAGSMIFIKERNHWGYNGPTDSVSRDEKDQTEPKFHVCPCKHLCLSVSNSSSTSGTCHFTLRLGKLRNNPHGTQVGSAFTNPSPLLKMTNGSVSGDFK